MKRVWVGGMLVLLLAGAAAAQTRVHVTDSKSWEVKGKVAGVDDVFSGTSSGGARPQTAEIIKTFQERCPEFTVTLNREKADFVVLLEHEGGKDIFSRDNKVVVFNKEGDAIYSGSTRSLGNAVKDSCQAIRRAKATQKTDAERPAAERGQS